MISETVALQQIARFSGLNFPKRNETALRELVRVLCDVAFNEDHAQQIVNNYVDNNDNFPTPVALRRAAGATRSGKPPRATCNICSNISFLITERGGLSGAGYCRCHPRYEKHDFEDSEE